MRPALLLFPILLLLLLGCASQTSQPAAQPAQIEQGAEPVPPTESPAQPAQEPESTEPAEAELPEALPQQPEPAEPEPEPPPAPQWQAGGIAIAGTYADADVVDLGNGNYRMYYSLEPEAAGFNGQVYSAVSSDGISWTQEAGTRKESATFPSVIKLPDGRYRMYFQNAGVIKSAISSDGLTWQDEPGTRMGTENGLGLNFRNVLAPTVINAGSEYIMVYAGAIDERYSAEMVPNSETHVLLWATSQDGLTFEKKGMAADSRNSVFKGWLDGPEWVEWDGGLRLYFWSYAGIYHITYQKGEFSEDAAFDFTTPSDNPMARFPENPPGDPTLAKIQGTWFMYYGQHTKGIFYAVYQ
ncbi:MAG: hypothetical protein Q7T16_04135 [Candidatus Burarchaeum sp.]|nr:hypothetical protein [Candidatus Burarchaeum sp.]MDO8339819.1 hypothetical protein [Candidatus Burarchaeum sp.]